MSLGGFSRSRALILHVLKPDDGQGGDMERNAPCRRALAVSSLNHR